MRPAPPPTGARGPEAGQSIEILPLQINYLVPSGPIWAGGGGRRRGVGAACCPRGPARGPPIGERRSGLESKTPRSIRPAQLPLSRGRAAETLYVDGESLVAFVTGLSPLCLNDLGAMPIPVGAAPTALSVVAVVAPTRAIVARARIGGSVAPSARAAPSPWPAPLRDLNQIRTVRERRDGYGRVGRHRKKHRARGDC